MVGLYNHLQSCERAALIECGRHDELPDYYVRKCRSMAMNDIIRGFKIGLSHGNAFFAPVIAIYRLFKSTSDQLMDEKQPRKTV